MWGMNIVCGQCGRESDMDKWTRTIIGGELPPNRYQCPHCRVAFEKRLGKPTVYPDGFVMPGPTTLVPVQATL